MPRTAVTLGKTHGEKGKWEMISDPSVPLSDQNKFFRSHYGHRSSEKFCLIRIQESDGQAKEVHLMTPVASAAHLSKIDAQNKAAVEAGKREEQTTRDAQKKIADARAEEHGKEIDRLNALQPKKPAVKAPAPAAESEETIEQPEQKPDATLFNADGLRTDGPTPAQWAEAGYKPENYPPVGYVAKKDVEPAPAAPDQAPAPAADKIEEVKPEATETVAE